MVNVITIARKEFSDLMTNGMVILLLVVYSIFLAFILFRFQDRLHSGQLYDLGIILHTSDFGILCSAYIFYMLRDFGAIIGVIIGCAAISNELHNHALNTLLSKPLYRDTIINGKLLGSLFFIALIMGLTASVYTACIFMICGDMLVPCLGNFVERLVVGFAVLTIYVSAFMAISMLISLVVRNYAFSLIFSTIFIFLSEMIMTTSFAGNISLMFPGDQYSVQQLIMSVTPDGQLYFITGQLFASCVTTAEALNGVMSYVYGLIIFLVIGLVLSYITFMRGDIV